jgi:SAM-dependent methyltransferase
MNRCPKCDARIALQPACPVCGFEPSVIAGFSAYAPDLARSAPGFDPAYYQTLAELEAGNFWFIARNELITWAFSKFFSNTHSYLEIGCGTGFVLAGISAAFPELTIHGSEIFVEGLGFAARRVPRARLFQMDACTIPFEDSYDVIGAFDVLEHIEDDRRVLDQIRRALKPGGGLILTVPQHPWLWSVQDKIAHHVRRYAQDELQEKIESSGFDILWTSSFVSLLLPAMALSRALRRTQTREVDPLSEFRIPRWMNSTFLQIMRVEIALLRSGLKFPIGGSRILIARRKN